MFTSPDRGVLLGRSPYNFSWTSMDGYGTKCRRNIAENYNGLSIGCTSVTDRRQTDVRRRATAYSEREREFTFAKKLPLVVVSTTLRDCVSIVRRCNSLTLTLTLVLVSDLPNIEPSDYRTFGLSSTGPGLCGWCCLFTVSNSGLIFTHVAGYCFDDNVIFWRKKGHFRL